MGHEHSLPGSSIQSLMRLQTRCQLGCFLSGVLPMLKWRIQLFMAPGLKPSAPRDDLQFLAMKPSHNMAACYSKASSTVPHYNLLKWHLI